MKQRLLIGRRRGKPGRHGDPLHFQGAASLEALWGAGPDAVFAAGAGGVILRYDGTEWLPMTSPTKPATLTRLPCPAFQRLPMKQPSAKTKPRP